MSCSSCNCNPCDCTTCDPDNEPLSSALTNFITAFFGTLTKTCVDGQVVWTLPCSLDDGIPGYPRVAGEGLACYFVRVFGLISESTFVRVDENDTTGGNLADKIAAGTGISLAILNPGGDEQLQVNNTGVLVEVDPVYSASEAALFVAGDKAKLDSALQPQASVAIAASDIDWSLANSFYKTLSANTVFTFSNTFDSKVIVVAITNTVGNFTVTWPGTIQWRLATPPVQTVGANTDVYTFVMINGIVYGSVVQAFS